MTTKEKPSLVKSHIQMPKLLLKRFHNKNNKFFYYDIEHNFIGSNGSAKSTNVEYGYYSNSTERYLRDEIETPFGEMLAYIDKVDFSQEVIVLPLAFEEIALNFIYALMARAPLMLSEMDKTSFFGQFLSPRTRHDYAVTEGISIAKHNHYFSDYILTFLINYSEIPFVLPVSGVYTYGLNGHSVINLPISPTLSICLVHKSYSDRIIQEDGLKTLFVVDNPDTIMFMNAQAVCSQKKHNWGWIICPEKSELSRLMNEAPQIKSYLPPHSGNQH